MKKLIQLCLTSLALMCLLFNSTIIHAEDIVEVSTWDELVTAVNDASDTVTIKLLNSLDAESKISIANKTVIIYTEIDDITITRTFANNSSGKTDPIFELTKNSDAKLTIGNDNGKVITIKDTTHRDKPSFGLINCKSDSTLNLSYVNFEDLSFGVTKSTNAMGAIVTDSATVNLDHVTMRNSIATNGALINIKNTTANITNTTIDNCSIWGTQQSGGGVIGVSGKSNVIIANCIISNNKSAEPDGNAYSTGAGLYLNGGNVSISNTEFSNNSSMLGGAIRVASASTLNLDDVSILNNTSIGDTTFHEGWQGAGIYASTTSGTITLDVKNSTISDNAGSFLGSGICLVSNKSGKVELTLDDKTSISDNQAVAGGGIYLSTNDTLTVNGATISNNKSISNDIYDQYAMYNGCGAGIYNDGGLVTINSGNITSNNAQEMGGAIFNGAGTVNIYGGIIDSNNASGTETGYYGSAIFQAGTLNLSSSPTINGDVYLIEGCVIDIPAAYNGSKVLIDIESDDTDELLVDETYQLGRNVVVYDSSLPQPDDNEIAKFVLAQHIQDDGYGLINEELSNDGSINKNILELGVKKVVPTSTPNQSKTIVEKTKVVTCEEYMNSNDWTWSEATQSCVLIVKVSDGYVVPNTAVK